MFMSESDLVTRCLWVSDMVMKFLRMKVIWSWDVNEWVIWPRDVYEWKWFGDEMFMSEWYGHEMFTNEWFGEMFMSESGLVKRCLWASVWPSDAYVCEWYGQDMFMSEYLGHEMFMIESDMSKICPWASVLAMWCLRVRVKWARYVHEWVPWSWDVYVYEWYGQDMFMNE